MSDLNPQPLPVPQPGAIAQLGNLSERTITEQTAALAAPLERSEGALVALLVFRVAGERFALPAPAVERVFAVRTVRRVPHRRRVAFRGMVAHEGEILLIGSMERLLDLSPDPAADAGDARMVLLGPAGRGWAFEVQSVEGVMQVRASDIVPAPGTVARGLGSATRALARLPGGDAAVLDADALRAGWEAAAA